MEHYYELKYHDGRGAELVYKFDDEVDLDELKDRLEYFLLGCSWSPNLVNKLLNQNLGGTKPPCFEDLNG